MVAITCTAGERRGGEGRGGEGRNSGQDLKLLYWKVIIVIKPSHCAKNLCYVLGHDNLLSHSRLIEINPHILGAVKLALGRGVLNRSFPTYLLPLFQNESSCQTIQRHIKMSLTCTSISMQIKLIFI